MKELQSIFNNREIAIGIWILIVIVLYIFIFTKSVKQFLKSVIPILFCRKFIVFYIVFIFHLCLATYLLYVVGFWTAVLLKDTIFWILLIELPLFVKTIEKAKDNHFFIELIKENLTITIIIDFVINYWTFSLITEMVVIPITVTIGLLYAFVSQKKEYLNVKKILDNIFVIFGIFVIINTINHLYNNPNDIFNFSALKEFLLPLLLLLLNIPVIYGLAIHNTYKQVFIRVKGNKIDNIKMKMRIIKFSGINLYKITAIRNNPHHTTMISSTDNDMKENLKKFKNRLSIRIGDNYMKRANYYILWCIVGFLVSILGIVICNFRVTLNDFVPLKFEMDITQVKQIITYICCNGVVISFCFLIYSLGYRKKKNEEISQVKKYALHKLFYLIKRQYGMLQEFPPINEPADLFVSYIKNAYELKNECDKDIASFENLLASWEFDIIRQLHTSVCKVVLSIGIDENEINKYTVNKFNNYYLEKTNSEQQNKQISMFKSYVEKDIENYSNIIKSCAEQFEHYF